jgi:hypothetical protein
MKLVLVVAAASGLLIGLSAVGYTQQAGQSPEGTKPGSSSGGPSETGRVIKRAPGSGAEATVSRSLTGRCKTESYQVPAVDTGKQTTINVIRC